jgi:hypothetical protein
MIKNIKYIAAFVLPFFMISCEDIVDIDANFQEPQLVIDAWVNNTETDQVIRLTNSQNYFDSLRAQFVTGASVKLIKNGITEYEFIDNGDGNYIWSPSLNERLGDVGDDFELEVSYDDVLYTATTKLNRTAIIDSISVEFREDELGFDDGYYAAVYARDIPGIGDAYWIKAYTNDSLNNKPQEISLSVDGTFDQGSNFDGLGFISPIRESINRVGDDGNGFTPYNEGDELRVEIHSVSNEGLQYMRIIQEQIVNGDNSIFALPVANATGNITNTSLNKKALGFFNVAAIISEKVTIQ